MFIVWLSKPINVFFIGLIGGASVTWFICRPWTSGCTNCCHGATRTPRSCVCYWSQCDDQTILWNGSKDLSHVFLHGSRRPGAADSTNQGPARGVDHRKSDSIANVILQLDAILVSVTDAITGTCTTSWAWGWSFSCSCQHKRELCWSLRERSIHGWLTIFSAICFAALDIIWPVFFVRAIFHLTCRLMGEEGSIMVSLLSDWAVSSNFFFFFSSISLFSKYS